ncbi:thiol reductant ABC exporter subunit CydC [Conyzicola sp.]|uniref:thiol reductant ABC exporter subunit CydC n=1 Tax=Conyzicola sp. TaxID=1969404 RepID=UPI00398A42E9
MTDRADAAFDSATDPADTALDTAAVLRLAQPPARRFVPGLLLGILASGSAVALLATSAWLITRASEQPPILFLGFAVVGVRAFALGRAFFRYVERLVTHDAAFRSLATLRAGIFRRLIPIAPDGLGGTRRGDLLTRLVSDVDQLQDLPLRVVQPLATSLVVSVLSVVTVSIILPGAGLTLLVALVAAAVVGTVVHSGITATADRAVAPLRAELAQLVLDFVTRLDVLTAFGVTEQREAAIAAADARLRSAQLRQALGAGVVSAAVSLLSGAAMIGALLTAAPAHGSGDITGPALALVVLVPIAVFEAFGMVPLAVGAWRRVRVSARRIADVVPDSVPSEIPVALAHGADLPTGPVTLTLDRVSARWPGAADRALRNVTVTVAPGDCLLVTGESGAGKTTLAHVLVRFLDHEGTYRLGGVDARELDPDAVRTIVGLCEQSPHLFDDTIRQNLLFARETATDDDLHAVLASVGLDEWVRERGGLDSPVGERGSLVSGGQAQRIALARALLAEFPILVLDEPTANVDVDRADALMADLLRGAAAADRAVIVISHTAIDSSLVTATLRLA